MNLISYLRGESPSLLSGEVAYMLVFESILERMKQVLDVKSDRQVALSIDVAPDNLNRWKKRNSIPIEKLTEFAMEHGLDMDWLLLGRDKETGSDAPTELLERFDLTQDEFEDFFVKIPIYVEMVQSRDAVSKFDEENKEFIFFPVHFLSLVLNDIYDTKNLAAIYITSDAMEPSMVKGSFMIVDRNETTLEDGKVFVFIHENSLYIRRIFYDITKNSVLLKSDNPRYPQLEIGEEKQDELKVIGKLIGYIGKMN